MVSGRLLIAAGVVAFSAAASYAEAPQKQLENASRLFDRMKLSASAVDTKTTTTKKRGSISLDVDNFSARSSMDRPVLPPMPRTPQAKDVPALSNRQGVPQSLESYSEPAEAEPAMDPSKTKQMTVQQSSTHAMDDDRLRNSSHGGGGRR
jgi:hypothetical protein